MPSMVNAFPAIRPAIVAGLKTRFVVWLNGEQCGRN